MTSWHNLTRALERILLFGVPGSGKTKAVMQILEKSVGNAYIIETDPTYDEFLDAYPHVKVREEYHGRESVTDYCSVDGTCYLYRCRNWEDYLWSCREVEQRAGKEDWVVVDNATQFWNKVQQWYVEKMYGERLDEFLMLKRQQLIEGGQLKNKPEEAIFHDWGTINGQYNQFRDFVLNPHFNLLLTAGQKKPDPRTMEQKAAKGLYGGIGFMPEGQKMLGHDVRSVLWLTKDSRFGEDQYMISSLKDREREKVVDLDWTDKSFFDVYLRKYGKWKPVSGKKES